MAKPGALRRPIGAVSKANWREIYRARLLVGNLKRKLKTLQFFPTSPDFFQKIKALFNLWWVNFAYRQSEIGGCLAIADKRGRLLAEEQQAQWGNSVVRHLHLWNAALSIIRQQE